LAKLQEAGLAELQAAGLAKLQAAGFAQTRSGSTQARSGAAQGLHSAGKKNLMSDYCGIGNKIFSRGPSIRLTSQHRRSAQALIGLGTGRSPSSSGCSPSAQTLLSRAQSRSSTLSSEPIMHFLTRPFCRGPLVKFCQWRCTGSVIGFIWGVN
jgi:hypothetical protein